MHKLTQDLTGKTFGKLTVINENGHAAGWKVLWFCKCECGNYTTVSGTNLKTNHTTSCGCNSSRNTIGKRFTKHGHCSKELTGKYHSMTREYATWCGIKDRCYNSNLEHYKNYGGRSITVCDRWLESFENFFEDMGVKPSNKHSIERDDVNGNYCKENYRWATQRTQAYNKRNSVWIEYETVNLPLSDWAIILEVPYSRMNASRHRKNKISNFNVVEYYVKKDILEQKVNLIIPPKHYRDLIKKQATDN